MLALRRGFGRNATRITIPGLLLAAALLLAACNPGTLSVERGWSGPVVDDDLLYIGSRSGKFLALELSQISEDGFLDLGKKALEGGRPDKWRFPKRDDQVVGAIYGTALVTEDRLFIGTLDRNLYALNKETGAEVWAYPTEGRIFGSPALYEDTLYVADDKGIVYAINERDGNLVWTFEGAKKRFWSTPIVADGVLYIGGMDKILYAVDARSGDLRWTFKSGGAIASTPVVVGGSVYFGAFDRRFYAVDLATQEKLWDFSGDNWFWNDPVFHEGVIYVGSLGDSFYALDASSGEMRWPEFTTESPVRARPIIVGDRIYLATRGGTVHGLDLNTGRERRQDRQTLGAKVLASLAEADGTLYVSDLKQRLHAIPVGSR